MDLHPTQHRGRVRPGRGRKSNRRRRGPFRNGAPEELVKDGQRRRHFRGGASLARNDETDHANSDSVSRPRHRGLGFDRRIQGNRIREQNTRAGRLRLQRGCHSRYKANNERISHHEGTPTVGHPRVGPVVFEAIQAL